MKNISKYVQYAVVDHLLLQKTPVSRFVLGYCGAVTSAVSIAVSTVVTLLVSVAAAISLGKFTLYRTRKCVYSVIGLRCSSQLYISLYRS